MAEKITLTLTDALVTALEAVGLPLAALDKELIIYLESRAVESTVAAAMKGYRVVDARNLLDSAAVRAAGLDYWGLGRPGA